MEYMNFGGYVEELLGSYILDIDSKAKLYNLLRKIKRIIKRQGQPSKVDTIFFWCYIDEEFYGKRGVRKWAIEFKIKQLDQRT